MKSAVFYGKHDLRVESSPVPEPGDHDVLIKVKACGVCGTDVHIYDGDRGAADVTPPVILGHEFSGIIVETGKKVTSYKRGDRVCIDPNCYCGNCGFCHAGLNQFCINMIGYGTTVNGGFAEYCCVSESQIYRLGDNTTFEQGAMAEPVACCLHGIEMCKIQPGTKVLIIGGGMIGLLMVQFAKLVGASMVVLMEPVMEKRKLGISLGADIAIDPVHENVVQQIQEKEILSFNTVIDCVGLVSTIEQAIELAGNSSVVMMFGLTKPDDTISVKPFDFFKKEIVLKSSYINPHTQKRALELIDRGRIDVSSMISEVCGLQKLETILKDPKMRAKGKYIIAPEM